MGTTRFVCYEPEKILKGNANPISRQTNRIIDNQLEKYFLRYMIVKEIKDQDFYAKFLFQMNFIFYQF
jgi:hypothetical protein